MPIHASMSNAKSRPAHVSSYSHDSDIASGTNPGRPARPRRHHHPVATDTNNAATAPYTNAGPGGSEAGTAILHHADAEMERSQRFVLDDRDLNHVPWAPVPVLS